MFVFAFFWVHFVLSCLVACLVFVISISFTSVFCTLHFPCQSSLPLLLSLSTLYFYLYLRLGESQSKPKIKIQSTYIPIREMFVFVALYEDPSRQSLFPLGKFISGDRGEIRVSLCLGLGLLVETGLHSSSRIQTCPSSRSRDG